LVGYSLILLFSGNVEMSDLPPFSSEVLSTMAYRIDVGQAAAVALIISLIGLVATSFYIRLQAREYKE
jgi:raffinose/stachyose/melibiose transport system permease protein